MGQGANEIDFWQRQIEQWVETQRPNAEIRDQLDIGFEWKNGTLVFFEIRPDWVNPEIIRHFPFAKARYIKSREVWKIYWLRASLKWEAYPYDPEVGRLDLVLRIIEEDKHNCFKG